MHTPGPTILDDHCPIPVIFYDGSCGICNRFIQFMLVIDRKEIFRFSALQGDLSRKHLPAAAQDLDTFIVIYQGEALKKWKALGRVFQLVGGAWSIPGFLMLQLPQSIGDMIYDCVACNRHLISRLFKPSCRILSSKERARFIE